MMNFKNEEAVSPVIGVILMVAITVILAAVIAAFVFGMTDNVQGTKVVSITSKIVDDHIEITLNGGADLSSLDKLTVKLGDTVVEKDGRFAVGDVIDDAAAGTTGRLLVIGKWNDGAEQIILDRTY